MNTFAHLIRLKDFQFGIVRYFSVHIEGNEINEFFDFLNRMEDLKEVSDDLSNLLVWIEEIGERYGAQKKYFRNESGISDTYALPPPKVEMKVHEIPVENLRLYCLVANEHVVFLFNGGIKTTNKAQDCPNVGPYFRQANRFAKAISALFHGRQICWNKDFSDIYFKTDLEFEL
jgi:hypothetical protein